MLEKYDTILAVLQFETPKADTYAQADRMQIILPDQ